MQQLSEFALNHWMLVSAFCVVLGLLIASLANVAGGLAVAAAVLHINRNGALPVDVRPAADYAAGHLLDAVHLPLAELDQAGERLRKYKDRPLLVYCASGNLSAQAVRGLQRQGFSDVQTLKGGIGAWRADNLPVTTS